MTQEQANKVAAQAKVDKVFSPTQTRMQLAMKGATNEQIKVAIPSATEWMI